MIGSITGIVAHISGSRILVEAHGVGYLIHTLPSFVERLHVENSVRMWTYMAVRETDISLYGFEAESELIMFEKLLSVSGIGPKSALAVLSIAGMKTLEEAIISGNTAILTKVAGVGKKTADKIVLELAGKITSSEMSESLQEDLDVLEALKGLGYREGVLKEVLKEMPKDLVGANEKIKQALKLLGKK